MNIDSNTIEQLFQEGKAEEVKKLIESELEKELSSKERGEALVNFARVYAEVSNSINQGYILALKEIVSDLEALKTEESKFNADTKLEEVRNNLENN